MYKGHIAYLQEEKRREEEPRKTCPEQSWLDIVAAKDGLFGREQQRSFSSRAQGKQARPGMKTYSNLANSQ
jgi:hypothetical protein